MNRLKYSFLFGRFARKDRRIQKFIVRCANCGKWNGKRMFSGKPRCKCEAHYSAIQNENGDAISWSHLYAYQMPTRKLETSEGKFTPRIKRTKKK